MSYVMRILIFIAALGIVGYVAHAKKESPKPIDNEATVMQAAENLPRQGMLERGPDGYVYLKVDDAYVNNLFLLLKRAGLRKPSNFNSRSSPIKAHISVMYKNEGNSVGSIAELGQSFSFSPTKIVEVKSNGKEYVILQVEAPELEALRKKYGLEEKLLGHEFHITLAQKRLHKRH